MPDVVAFITDAKLVATMDFVRTFLFGHGILGEGATSPDSVSMAFPGDATLGDTANVELRFDPAYREVATARTL